MNEKALENYHISTTFLHPDTHLLNIHGDIICNKNLKVGDMLLGDDLAPRTVVSVCSGEDEMFEIIPTKGKKFICNITHILTLSGIIPYISIKNNHKKKYALCYSDKGNVKYKFFSTMEEAELKLQTLDKDIFDILILDYLNTNKTFKEKTYLFHIPINWKEQQLPFDPYMIGYWLGDGSSNYPAITTIDPEIIEFFEKNLIKYGLKIQISNKITYNIVGNDENYGKVNKNEMMNTLRNYNLFYNKHIPKIYLVNSKENRLKLLAGIVDSDGYNHGNCLEIVQKSDQLANDIELLSFSLGFMVTSAKRYKSWIYLGEKKTGLYNVLTIFGEGLEEIPTLLERKKFHKREQSKRATCQGFKIKPLGIGNYNGFTLDGNGKFLLSDCIVTRANCS